MSRDASASDDESVDAPEPPADASAYELLDVLSTVNEPLLTRRQAAEIARMHVSTLDRAIKRGYLKAGHIGGGRAVRIARAELYAWLNLPPDGQEPNSGNIDSVK